MKKWIYIILLCAPLAQAKLTSFKSANYEAAEKSASYVKFDMKSTKLGLITTGFTGYVKDFSVEGEVEDRKLKSGATLTFPARSLDTDIDGRNEKMWDLCLDAEHHDNIKLILEDAVEINGEPLGVSAKIDVRGKSFPITLTVTVADNGNEYLVDVSGTLSLKALEIPDPSIAIASVKDLVLVSSHFVIGH